MTQRGHSVVHFRVSYNTGHLHKLKTENTNQQLFSRSVVRLKMTTTNELGQRKENLLHEAFLKGQLIRNTVSLNHGFKYQVLI